MVYLQPSPADRLPLEERVLVLAAERATAEHLRATLEQAGLQCEACADGAALRRELEAGAGAVIVSKDLLRDTVLLACLEQQPAWSDLPLIVIGGPQETDGNWRLLEELGPAGNVTLLEQPVRPVTLVSAARVAVRARRRQYELRDHLAEHQQGEAALHAINETLERRVAQRTALLALLHEVATAANRAASLEDALAFAIERLGRRHGWCYGHAWLTNEDDPDELRPTGIGYAEPRRMTVFLKATQRLRLRRGEGLPGRVLASGKVEWIREPDAAIEPLRHGLAARLGFQTGLAFPVLAGREVVAVLEFFADHALPPDPRTLEALSSVGWQLGRVAERNRTELRLRSAERLASMGTFAAGVAHEINNPLASILMTARYALRPQHDRAAVNEFLNEIIQDAERCARIVRSVQQFARDGPTERWAVNLNELLQRVAHVVRREAEPAGVTLDLPAQEPAALVTANPVELEQALASVLRNAVQASRSGQGIVVRLEVEPEQVRVCVADRGRGMSETEQEHAFDPFFTTRAAQGGSGLGLSMAHGIVTKHHGTIEIASQRGRGTTITVTLPRTPSAVAPEVP